MGHDGLVSSTIIIVVVMTANGAHSDIIRCFDAI